MTRTKTRVSARRLAAGDLPTTCVVSGRPADHRVPMTYRWVPDWTWILLLFGIFPFFIARMFAAQDVATILPVAHDTLVRYRKHRRLTWGLILGSIALIVCSPLASTPVLAWVGFAGLLGAGASIIVINTWWVGVTPLGVSGDVELRRVHREFARQVELSG